MHGSLFVDWPDERLHPGEYKLRNRSATSQLSLTPTGVSIRATCFECRSCAHQISASPSAIEARAGTRVSALRPQTQWFHRARLAGAENYFERWGHVGRMLGRNGTVASELPIGPANRGRLAPGHCNSSALSGSRESLWPRTRHRILRETQDWVDYFRTAHSLIYFLFGEARNGADADPAALTLPKNRVCPLSSPCRAHSGISD